MTSQTLSVIMPAYQLEDEIEKNIDTVFRTLAAHSPEVVVIDDGSTDGTGEAIRRAQTAHPDLVVRTLRPNRGKGRALLTGWEASSGDVVVFLDADLDLPPDQIPPMVDLLDGAHVVVGTKRQAMAGGAYPDARRALSRAFAWLTRAAFRLPVSETQTGIKLFRREVLERVGPHVHIDRYAFDLELLARAHAAGFRLTETPVRLGPGAATSSLRARMMWELARDTVRILWWRLTDPAF